MEKEPTRSQNSIKNATISLVYYFISSIFTFVMRIALIRYIGIEYAGLNSLLTNIIGVLNIAELGLSTAIGYSLYKPLADGDHEKINEILCLYKYLYRIIAVVVAVIGIFITIFINHFVNTTIPMSEVRISFILYLIATVVSYLLTFLTVLPSADQKNYFVVKIQNDGKIIKNILQLIAISVLKNFYAWVIIEIGANIVIYMYTNYKTKKMYTWYKSSKGKFKELLKKYKNIVKTTKDTAFHRIGGLVVYQTDTILISYFCNLTDSGIYSNYMLIYSLLTGLVEQAFIGITASIGNFIIEKKPKEVYNIWKEMYIVMCFVTVLFGFLFYQLANPFVGVVFGNDLTLSSVVVFGIALNIMFRVIKNPIDKFKEAYGIFWDRYSPIVESIINLVVSVALAFKFGILGIVLGTVASNIAITMLWKPYVIFKYIFKEKLSKFFLITLKYTAIGLVGSGMSYAFIKLLNMSTEYTIVNLIKLFAVNGIISFIVILGCFLIDKQFRESMKKYCSVAIRMVKK